MKKRGTFIVSIDCEMLWGMRDHATKQSLTGSYVLVGHNTMLKILELFKKYNIHATWAFVGLCLLESKKQIYELAPQNKPTYCIKRLSNYEYIDNDYIDKDGPDPHYYSGDMASIIAKTPGQEIGTHTFSHYYCWEEGQTASQFKEDLACSIKVSKEKLGISPKTIVFPRNQVNKKYLEILKSAGIERYRGRQRLKSTRKTLLGKVERAVLRFLTIPAYMSTYDLKKIDRYILPMNIPGTFMFETYNGKRKFLIKRGLRVMKNVMTLSAIRGKTVHMYFHPHNFGCYTEENLAYLEELLQHYTYLNKKYGFQSINMREV